MIQDLTAFTMTASIDLIETSFAGLTFRSFWSMLSFWQKHQKYLLGWKKSLIWCENWKRIFIWELNLFSFWSPMLSQNSDESMILGGSSLAIQGLRLPASNTGNACSVPGRGAKIPHAMWLGKKKKKTLCPWTDTQILGGHRWPQNWNYFSELVFCATRVCSI